MLNLHLHNTSVITGVSLNKDHQTNTDNLTKPSICLVSASLTGCLSSHQTAVVIPHFKTPQDAQYLDWETEQDSFFFFS